MKKFLFIILSFAGLIGLISFSAAAAGTDIDISWNFPFIQVDITDDPDDPLEVYTAQYKAPGSNVWDPFWDSSSPDPLTVPAALQVSGSSFRVVGSTALGSSFTSNVITYSPLASLPFIVPHFDISGSVVEWEKTDISTFTRVTLVLSRSGSSDFSYLVGENGAWLYNSLDLFALDLSNNLSLADNSEVTLKLVGVSGGTIVTGGIKRVTYLNPALHQKLVIDTNDMSVSLPYAFYDRLRNYITLTSSNVVADVEWIDTSSTLQGPWTFFPLGSFYLTASESFRNQLVGSVGNWQSMRSLLIRYKVIINGRTFTGPWETLSGLDELAAVPSVPEDTLLVKPESTDILAASNLIFSGVKHTKVYTYVFSALMLLAPWFCLVFVIKKVH